MMPKSAGPRDDILRTRLCDEIVCFKSCKDGQILQHDRPICGPGANFIPCSGCAGSDPEAICRGTQERAVPQTHYQNPGSRAAQAVADTRADAQVTAIATLILSVLLVLLSGAVWMQLT